MALWPVKWTVNCSDYAPLPISTQLRKRRTAATLLCMPWKTLKLKCQTHFTTETEITVMGQDSLTHVQHTAAEPDSGWHLERLEFMVNTDDKDSWLAHFKICGAERTKALGALIWAHNSASLFSEAESHNSEESVLSSSSTVRLESQLKKKSKVSNLIEMVDLLKLWLE